ncbi:MAG: copper resistance system multicopper oxidase [Gammaproteobacteria bacterium]|nr:copper resistance system multicopper oxidase [Gammaproteobacteria bacterium]
MSRILLPHNKRVSLSRRRFVQGLTAGGALLAAGISTKPAHAKKLANYSEQYVLRGNRFDLTHRSVRVNFTGKERYATAINGSVPGPILRWKEGDKVTLRVKNQLAEDTSIHWHGLILPASQDGVPGISEGFNGIKPGESFTYQFPVIQSGTYWYHSHSGFQEQTGSYGAIIIDPKEPEPFSYDRDYVVMLSDWSDENPNDIYAKLKKLSHYYNFRERTVSDALSEIEEKGWQNFRDDHRMWNQMRMSDRDISDVTGYTYTFLMNGVTPADGWTGLFKRGEKVRLRFINAAAMTFFDVRIPDLKMTVVATDGQLVEPISIDEFRIGVAETYDVIVEPKDDRAYSIFAQAIDRSGYAHGTLTPDASLTADIPPLDKPPILTHSDMGMAHSNHTMSAMDHSKHNMPGMNHNQQPKKMPTMGSGGAGYGSNRPVIHAVTEFGPHVDMRADTADYRLDDPGIGLRDNGRRVLTYADLHNLYKTFDHRQPSREIDLHLTGNMSRYMWSFNGVRYADAEPLRLKFGERVRINLINDTMMNHPIHLHGMWSELETGEPDHIPRKHTIIVQPGAKISYLVTADAMGSWAYHCHLAYHMAGMFRKVVVS